MINDPFPSENGHGNKPTELYSRQHSDGTVGYRPEQIYRQTLVQPRPSLFPNELHCHVDNASPPVTLDHAI